MLAVEAGLKKEVSAAGLEVTLIGSWTKGMKEGASETDDTKKDADTAGGDGDDETTKPGSALNLVAGSATLLAVSTMMLQ